MCPKGKRLLQKLPPTSSAKQRLSTFMTQLMILNLCFPIPTAWATDSALHPPHLPTKTTTTFLLRRRTAHRVLALPRLILQLQYPPSSTASETVSAPPERCMLIPHPS